MRNKATLVLMEQLVMILVFALAAVLCMQAFVSSDAASRDTARTSRAAFLCQNVAETLKAHRDLETAAVALGAERAETGWRLEEEDLVLVLRQEESDLAGLGRATVEVHGEGRLLFSLTVGWQEVAP